MEKKGERRDGNFQRSGKEDFSIGINGEGARGRPWSNVSGEERNGTAQGRKKFYWRCVQKRSRMSSEILKPIMQRKELEAMRLAVLGERKKKKARDIKR